VSDEDNNRQSVIPPNALRLPTRSSSSLPTLPPLITGNSAWPFERGRYERNAAIVRANANYLQARTEQADACLALIKKREQLLLAIASLRDLPEKVAHQRELGRLSRLNELRLAQLQHQISEVNASIELAAASVRLAQYFPVKEPPPPAPVQAQVQQAAPVQPKGLTPTDVRAALQQYPDIKPDAIEPIIMMLMGLMAEKNQ
jgi:hypothetical protein